MDIFWGAWGPRSDHQVPTTPKPIESETTFTIFRNRWVDAIKAAITFLNDTVHSFGFQTGNQLSTKTTAATASITTTTAAAAAASGVQSSTIPSATTAATAAAAAAAAATTATVTATTAAANTPINTISRLLTTLASVTNSSDVFNNTVAAAVETIITNISILAVATDTDYVIDNGALGSFFGWTNSTLYLTDVNDSFIDVGNSFIGGSGSAIATIYSNSSIATTINITLLSTAIIGATNSTFGDETTWQLIEIVAKSIILGFVILATVIGNVFVIAAILLERNLQSVANHLILSLAVADLLVACLVMPLGAVYEVSKEWKLGPELCDMWTASDVLCCTSSILHLVIIALDRYWAVTNIDYVHQRTGRRIGLMIFLVWIFSFSVSIAPMLGWKDPDWNKRIDDLECLVSQDVYYQIFATASSFYVPLLIILVLYWRIFQTARKRIRRRQQGKSIIQLMPKVFVTATGSTQPTGSSSGLIASAAGGSGGIAAAVVTIIGRPLPTISETTTAFTNISSTNTSPEKVSCGNGVDRPAIDNDPPTNDISIAYPSTTTSVMPPTKSIARKKPQSSVDSKRERKAAKTLAIITGAFVCCWLPFFVIAILLPTCTSCDISPLVVSLCLWLGYINSMLNPVIYTIFSPEFRHAFKRLLCGRRNSIRRRTGVRR